MSRPDFPEDNNVVVWSILGHLCSHPDAKDTEDGIGRWWLTAKGIETDAAAVRAALCYLVERGWLITMERGSVSRMYGLNQERKTVLQQFLHGQSKYR